MTSKVLVGPRGGQLHVTRCLNCKSPFTYHKSRQGGKFCSNECQHAHSWTQHKREIKSSGKFNSHSDARKYLLEKFGHRCSICGRKSWMNQPIPLVLDHVDGNSTNWSVKNVRHVCANCDRQLPTFGARNKGNGRKNRLEKLQAFRLKMAQLALKRAKIKAATAKLHT